MKKPENVKTDAPAVAHDCSVKNARCISTQNGTMVVADIIVNDVTIYGCRVVESQKGDFLAFPSHKGKDGNYYNYAYVRLSDEEQKKVLADIEKMIN